MFKTMLIGNLGADATTQTLQSGKTVVNFSVAVTKKYRDQQGNIQEKTTWIGISYWPKNLAVVQYLKKGQQVFVEGEIEARAYTTNTNAVAAALNLVCFNIQLIGGKKADPAQQQQTPPAPTAADITEPLDDLPF